MSDKPNMLAIPKPWDLVAGGYAETTMQMLAQYAEEAISIAKLQAGEKVLDVACGPGTVSLMVAGRVDAVHAIDFSASMLSVLDQKIGETGVENIRTHHGDGQNLPYENDMFDAAFSMFGLMFFPDRGKGFSEICRTLKSGGRISVSSWAPVDQSPAMQAMFGALKVINPNMPEPETAVESLENPEQFEKELCAAGFRDVSVQRITKCFPIESVQGFWADMVKGSVPITMMKSAMDEGEWLEREVLALDYLKELLPNTPTSLASDAWLGTGIK